MPTHHRHVRQVMLSWVGICHTGHLVVRGSSSGVLETSPVKNARITIIKCDKSLITGNFKFARQGGNGNLSLNYSHHQPIHFASLSNLSAPMLFLWPQLRLYSRFHHHHHTSILIGLFSLTFHPRACKSNYLHSEITHEWTFQLCSDPR